MKYTLIKTKLTICISELMKKTILPLKNKTPKTVEMKF